MQLKRLRKGKITKINKISWKKKMWKKFRSIKFFQKQIFKKINVMIKKIYNYQKKINLNLLQKL